MLSDLLEHMQAKTIMESRAGAQLGYEVTHKRGKALRRACEAACRPSRSCNSLLASLGIWIQTA